MKKKFVLLVLYLFIGFIPLIIFAQDKKLPVLEAPDLKVSLPGIDTFQDVSCTGDYICKIPWIGQYVVGIQRYAIGIVGIIAVIVLMIGGVIWLTAAGNSTQVGRAKKMISGSLVGLFLVFGSYIILFLINPALTKFKPLKISYIPNIKLDTEAPIVSGFASDGVSYSPRDKDQLIANVSQLYDYKEKNIFSYFIKTAQAKCSLTLHPNNEGDNLRNDFFYQNSVPAIYCPHAGGAIEIPKIIDSIYEKNIITYRYGGKGSFVKYNDGEGGDHGHTCNQDPECAEQLKGHENEDDNCKYCCPKGQACLDCSAFVNHVLSCAGLPIVDSGTKTMNGCQEKFQTIDYNYNSVNGIPLIPGDLLVKLGHVIMYIGDGLTAESVPTPKKADFDSGRRPGKGLLITQLKRPPPYTEYDFLTVIRSSKESYERQCFNTDQSCDRSDECCSGLICSNGWMNRQYLGSCKQCIPTWDWNCTKNADCCNNLDKCRKQSNDHWKCVRGLIPDWEWDCEIDSDCLSPSATCDPGGGGRYKCVPH